MDKVPSSEKLYSSPPVDSGFSWVICFASFVCYFINGVCIQTLSVLFLDLATELNTTFTMTSLSIVFNVIFLSLSSVISVTLWVPRFGESQVIIVAGLTLTLSTIGCSLSPDVFTFIAFCALQGVSLGAFSVPVIGILGFYFDKRLALAITLGTSGRCLASIVAPHLIQALNEEYGLRGTYLVLSGLHLHVVAVGMLLRPAWSKRNTQVLEIKLKSSDTNMEQRESYVTFTPPTGSQTQEFPSPSAATRRRFESLLMAGKMHKVVTISEPSLYEKSTKSSDAGTPTDAFLQLQAAKRLAREGMSSPVDPMRASLSFMRISSDTQLRLNFADLAPRSTKVSSYSTYPSGFDSSRVRRYQLHSGSLSVASTVESAASAFGTKGGVGEECCDFSWLKVLKSELFTQWTFCFFLLVTLAGATNRYLLMYVPTIAVYLGATKEEGASILTVCGSVDLASRIFVGCIADKGIVRPTQIVSVAQTCLGQLVVLCCMREESTELRARG
ncbi:hypothetical protein Btru_055907 [Bulinus truncatus]|nr:hypothetical protein Btru_055907 [Bulinus truncatus]